MSEELVKRRRLLVLVAGVVLFCSFAFTTLPGLVSRVRSIRELWPMSREQRRAHKLGPFYSSILKLRQEVPANEPLALITEGGGIDAALFANYYLYPHPARVYAGRNSYRNSASEPSRPSTIVETGEVLRRSTYASIRDRDLRKAARVVSNPALSEPRTEFIIPLVCSIDGPEPDTYVVEATILNPNDGEATVRITLQPMAKTATIVIPSHGTRSWYDLVYEEFQMMEIGWMRIQSSVPVRMASYFVNRGRNDAVALRPIVWRAASVQQASIDRDGKVWLLNLSDAAAIATVNGEPLALAAHAITSRPVTGVPRIHGDVYAFLSTRDRAGRTRFYWP